MNGAILMLAGLLLAEKAAAQAVNRVNASFFQIRVEPDLNDNTVYRAFYADPGDRSSLAVQRGRGYLGDQEMVDVRAANCPALAEQLAALDRLPMPALFLGERPGYLRGNERVVTYYFDGFVRFPNDGTGELSFIAYDTRTPPADPRAAWAKRLVAAFEACARRR